MNKIKYYDYKTIECRSDPQITEKINKFSSVELQFYEIFCALLLKKKTNVNLPVGVLTIKPSPWTEVICFPSK